MSQIKQRENRFTLPLHFCSIQALNRLDEACPHWGGQSTLLCLLTQMPISFGDTLTDTSGNNALLAVWTSLSPVKLTHKITHQLCTYSMAITAGLIFTFS